MNRRGRSSKLWAVPAAAVFAWPFLFRGGSTLSAWWLLLVVPLGWWSCVKAYDALWVDDY